MKIQKPIALIGMMGVGKTSVGRRLAKRLELPFFDSDQEVEVASCCTISDIYALYGEQAFIDVEEKVIKRLLNAQPHVLSTGVAAFVHDKARQAIKENAIVIWLYAEIESILPRLTKRAHRPQLMEGNPKETIQRLMKDYHPIYAEADIRVDCSNLGTTQAVSLMIESLEHYLTQHSFE